MDNKELTIKETVLIKSAVEDKIRYLEELIVDCKKYDIYTTADKTLKEYKELLEKL